MEKSSYYSNQTKYYKLDYLELDNNKKQVNIISHIRFYWIMGFKWKWHYQIAKKSIKIISVIK